MIEKLKTRSEGDRYGNITGVIYPSNIEIFNKINEIIEHINSNTADCTSMLVELIDRIDHDYLCTDGTYDESLSKLVSDYVKHVKCNLYH